MYLISYHLPEHFVSQGISGPAGDWTHQAAGNPIPLLCLPRFMLWPSLFRNPLFLIMLPYPDPLSKSIIPNSSLHKDSMPERCCGGATRSVVNLKIDLKRTKSLATGSSLNSPLSISAVTACREALSITKPGWPQHGTWTVAWKHLARQSPSKSWHGKARHGTAWHGMAEARQG